MNMMDLTGIVRDEDTGLTKNAVMEKLYDGESSNELSDDYSLPDYLPDIRKIVRVGAKPQLNGKYMNGEKVEFEGRVFYEILYISSENTLKVIAFDTSFEQNVPIVGLDENCIVTITPLLDTVNCRLSGPRKLTMKSRIRSRLTAVTTKNPMPNITDAAGGSIRPEDRDTVEMHSEKIQSCYVNCLDDSEIQFSEDIEIDAALPPIGEILSTELDAIVMETKCQAGKILYKGEITAAFLCQCPGEIAENGEPDERYISINKKIPFSRTLEADTVGEQCECFAEPTLENISAKPASNAFGEAKMIELDFTMSVDFTCYENKEAEIINDAYSTAYDLQSTAEPLRILTLYQIHNSNFSVNGTLTPDESMTPAEILDLRVCSEIFDAKQDKGKFVFNGSADVSAVTRLEDGTMSGINGSIPFKYEIDSGNFSGNPEFRYQCKLLQAKPRLESGKLTVDIEIAVCIAVFDMQSHSPIKNIILNKDKRLMPSENASILLYYPHAGEDLWSIAKNYRVGADALKRANNIQESKTQTDASDKVLFIPVAERKYPSIFSNIV